MTDRPTEAQVHAAVIAWCRLVAPRDPQLRYLYHTPNGELRSKATAGRLQALGVAAGVPDLLWPVPRCGATGLALELKRRGGVASAAQADWLALYANTGWQTHTIASDDWRDAAAVIAGYSGRVPDPWLAGEGVGV